ncbi:MAG: hypothetical protein JO103_06350, partial [Candidatus Eremiobacteraeota bacterium]|nr:hypothetical protein [Candidatus Eremiobacteraeota bacterium]
VMLAALAYGVYLFHKPVTYLARRYLDHHAQTGSLRYAALMTLFTVPVAFAVAYAGHRYVDRPFLRRNAHDRRMRAQRAAQTSPALGRSATV